ncbi:MAG: methylenetetrahydrofolate reductase [Anaerolineae bacterium]|jgi:methylenetetrahydrofolate reductase (NADPH)
MPEPSIPGPQSRLAQRLAAGQFVVTAELSPPRSAHLGTVEHEVEVLRDHVDAANVTDNQAANVRMSSLAVSITLAQRGLEPVMQMTCRDRNRLAMQSDLLGASAYGIRNLLCLTGDHGKWGDHPAALNVWDLDSVHLLRMVRNMVDGGCYENGRPIPKVAPNLYIGGAANPFAPPYEYRPLRLAKKVAAGARFVQTQIIYNVNRFQEYMARVRDLGLHERVHIIAGVAPIRSAGAARFMAENVAGMDVPPAIVERMAKTPKAAQPVEGVEVCLEIIDQVRGIEGVSGIHITAINWAEIVPEIVSRAGLWPRPNLQGTLS